MNKIFTLFIFLSFLTIQNLYSQCTVTVDITNLQHINCPNGGAVGSASIIQAGYINYSWQNITNGQFYNGGGGFGGTSRSDLDAGFYVVTASSPYNSSCPQINTSAPFEILEAEPVFQFNPTQACPSLCNVLVTSSMQIAIPSVSYTYQFDANPIVSLPNSLTNQCGGSHTYEIFANNISCGIENIGVSQFAQMNLSTSVTNATCTQQGSATVIITGVGASGLSTYCSSIPQYPDYTTIDNIVMVGDNTTISNNTSSICDTYEDYTALSVDVTPGSSYNLNIDLGTCHTGGFALVDIANIYVDWNIDGDFNDLNEWVGQVNPTQSPSTHTISITVPVGAIPGQSRMRIVAQNNQYQPTNQALPCDVNTAWFGSTEDYTLVVNGSVAMPVSYLWSDGQTTATANNLSSGTYTVTITDANGCSATDTAIVNGLLCGCTDPLAVNYDPAANTDDGSCTYFGCTHKLELYDLYGDGWNGATVDLKINGSNVSNNATVSDNQADAHGFTRIIDFVAITGDNISLDDWISGSSDNQIVWAIKDGNGNVINSGMYGDGTTNVPAYCAPCKVSVHDEDFETLPFTGWNSIQTNTASSYTSSTVLGEFIGNPPPPITLSLGSLPSHDSLSIEFDLYIRSSWDGNGAPGPDNWDLELDNTPILETTFSNSDHQADQSKNQLYPNIPYTTNSTYTSPNYGSRTGASQVGPGITGNSPPNFSLYEIKKTIPHTSNTATFDFFSNVSGLDEVWAIDNVKVYILSPEGCTDPAACNYDPLANCDDGSCVLNIFVTAGSNQTICNGYAPSSLNASSGGVTGTYSWVDASDPLVVLGSGSNFSPPPLTTTTTYTVTFTDLVSGCIATDQVTITVNPIPTATLSVIPNPACVGENILLTATASIPVNQFRFQYNNGGGWINMTSPQMGNNNPISYNNITNTTQFRVRVREGTGCGTGPWSPIILVPISVIATQPINHN